MTFSVALRLFSVQLVSARDAATSLPIWGKIRASVRPAVVKESTSALSQG